MHVKRESFLLAMELLQKHFEMSKFAHKTQAMEALSALEYKGDPKVFHSEALTCVANIQTAKCTVEDFIYRDILNAFSQEHKQIRYDIAKEINSDGITQTNLFDKLHGFCSQLEALKPTGRSGLSANCINEELHCSRCKRKGHVMSDCYATKDRHGRKLTDEPPARAPSRRTDKEDSNPSRQSRKGKGKHKNGKPKANKVRGDEDEDQESNSDSSSQEEGKDDRWTEVLGELASLTKVIKSMKVEATPRHHDEQEGNNTLAPCNHTSLSNTDCTPIKVTSSKRVSSKTPKKANPKRKKISGSIQNATSSNEKKFSNKVLELILDLCDVLTNKLKMRLEHNVQKANLSRRSDRSVLDTGSAVILMHDCEINDPSFIPVSGFNGSTTRTEGSGYAPLKFRDTRGEEFVFRFPNSHKMASISEQIMGFGPLLRMKFQLFARDVDDIKLVFPTGRMVDVTLDDNDILYIYHEP